MATSTPGPSSVRLLERLRALTSPDLGEGHEDVRHRGVVISVCILASVLLWFTFAIRKTYTRSMDFPLTVRALDPGESLSGLPPPVVRAQVVGEGIQLLRLYYDRPSIELDATESVINIATIAPDFVQGVRLEALSPREVTLARERREVKRVPVVSRTTIETRAGHHVVGSVRLSPDSVQVSGAGSIIHSISRWTTQAGSVLAGPDSLDALIALSDSLSGLVTLDIADVQMTASIRQFTEATRVVDVRVIGTPEGRRISIEPGVVRVTYQVPLNQYQVVLNSDELFAFVSYERILADTAGAVQPLLHGPEGIVFRGVSFDPPLVRYFNVLNER